MAVNDALGTRMKEFYENVPKTRLVRRMPVAIRTQSLKKFGQNIEISFSQFLHKSREIKTFILRKRRKIEWRKRN